MNIGFDLLSSDRPPGAGKVEGGAYTRILVNTPHVK